MPAAIIVIGGLAIGAWLATFARGPEQRAQRVATATAVRTNTAAKQSAADPAVSTPAVRVLPTAATPMRTAAATAAPAPTLPATSAPRTIVATANGAPVGSWEVDEANVRVGTIVWVGQAVMSGSNAVSFDAHKETVAGRPASPCERDTHLRTTFAVVTVPQMIPYREINCAGTISTGEVRVRSFSVADSSFSGSFWQEGAKLGDFTGHRVR